MSKNPSWKTLSSKYVYENHWIKVRHDEVETPNGKKGIFGLVEGRPFVLIIPKINEDFYLIETYRYTVNKLSLEFPAGGIEEGDSIETTVNKELEQEVGLVSENITKLEFLYSSNGFSNVGFTIFLADNCSKTSRHLEDLEEGMAIKKYNLEELKKFIKSGYITDSPTVSAFCLYQLKYH